MKKMNKVLPISYREYLDMDTDEEEFGVQETPEPNDDVPAEPERPVFTDKELEILVQYVKNLAVLNLNNFNLSVEAIDIIEEYFRNPSHTILSIFYEAPEYKALLDIPYYSNSGLIYFLRSPWQIYTPHNFMSTVCYGNFNRNMENSVLKFLENVYAPVAFGSKAWPKVTEDQVFWNLNEFLISLTNTTYQHTGIPILYISWEGIQNSQKYALKNKNLILDKKMSKNDIIHSVDNNDNAVIERLERIAHHWIKKIRSVLYGINMPSKSVFTTIIDEIQIYKYRFENLNCLQYQLASESVTTIIDILEQRKSSSVSDIHLLITKINATIFEVTSSITYLNLLLDYCCDFEVSYGIEIYATNILLLIRFIGIEAQFYNTTENIEVLCRALGTQIIIQCKKHVDLEIVLESDPKIGKHHLKDCINCCENFVKIYNEIAIMDKTSNISTFSKIDEKKAFSHINTFIQRCQDLIEVVDARIVFDQCKYINMFGGPKAMKHELHYQKIQKLFHEILDEIKQHRNCILDVTVFTWLEKILNFRCKIEIVDNLINNLIHNIFNNVVNVEEGLVVLYSMKNFMRRKNLRETLQYYWIMIWNLFDEELNSIITSIDNKSIIYGGSESFSINTATLLYVKKNYLTRQYDMLIDASDWFDDNSFTLIIEKYTRVQTYLTEGKNA